MIPKHPSAQELAAAATRRRTSLFSEDLRTREGDLRTALAGRRLLVIGGAGSIGAATVRCLARLEPGALHVVDQNENTLVELVRDLRSSPAGTKIRDASFLPLDFGGASMHRHLLEDAPYDLVFNFAALKHVRSEKSAASILQLLDVNVLKVQRLLAWLEGRGRPKRYFGVSTDKAADPVNLMGASKRMMEEVLFRMSERPAWRSCAVTSARFANVAFSDGSLLDGFLRRLSKGQPLAVPRGTRRFLISLPEAGELCLIAALLVPGGTVGIPSALSESDALDLVEVAEAILHAHGLKARHTEDPQEARATVEEDLRQGRYPLLITPADTTGEKDCEVFVGKDETSVDLGLESVLGVRPPRLETKAFEGLLEKLGRAMEHPGESVTKAELVRWISTAVPAFRHHESGRSLDERM